MKKHILKILSAAAITTFLGNEIILPLPLAAVGSETTTTTTESSELPTDSEKENTETIEEKVTVENEENTPTESEENKVAEDVSTSNLDEENKSTEQDTTSQSTNETTTSTSENTTSEKEVQPSEEIQDTTQTDTSTKSENKESENSIPTEAWNGNEDLIKEVLNNTGISDISKVTYDDIKTIESVNLSGTSYSIPDILGDFTGLKNLNLKSAGLSEFPQVICNLTNLEILNLECNKITTIPDSISNLTLLKELYLNMNKITDIPNSIFSITTLNTLGLFDNNLVSIPDSITNSNGINLDISYNQIYALPEAPNATIIYDNTFLPDSTGKQLKLINNYLNLSTNQTITQDTLHNLVEASDPSHTTKPLDSRINLEFVIDNKIVSPDELASYDKGVYNAYLKIQGTDITNINAITSDSLEINIDKASTEENTKVPYEEWEDCTPLMDYTCQTLGISDIKDVTYKDLATIEKIDLSVKFLDYLPGIVSKFVNVKSVNLSSNKFTDIPDQLLTLKNINELNMDSNQLTSISDKVAELSALELLHLNDNDITSISEKLSTVQSLHTLVLAGNKNIKNCIPEICNINSLEKLYLTDCKLTTVNDDDLNKLTNLKELFISYNQLLNIPNIDAKCHYDINIIPLTDGFYKQLKLKDPNAIFTTDDLLSQEILKNSLYLEYDYYNITGQEDLYPDHEIEFVVDNKIISGEELSKYPSGTYTANLIIKGADINNTAAQTKDTVTINISNNDANSSIKQDDNKTSNTPATSNKNNNNTSNSTKANSNKNSAKSNNANNNKTTTKTTSNKKIPYTGSEIAIISTILGILAIGSGAFIFKNKKNNK